MITQERLSQVLSYDAITGEFRWLKRPEHTYRQKIFNLKLAGKVAGFLHPEGYLKITIDRRQYSASRLAWLYCHGFFPPAEIDHRNGRRADNRLENLRISTKVENNRNRRREGIYLKGVSFNDRMTSNPWRARITDENGLRHLGYFPSERAAHAAYVAAATEKFGEFARAA